MSDLPNQTPGNIQPAPPAKIDEHLCEHPGCWRWGAFGFARGRAKATWFCGVHRNDGERLL